MKKLVAFLTIVLLPCVAFAAEGVAVNYDVDGQPYEGYFITPKKNAPFVLMIHDWDGLTGYEMRRADMLNDMGYAVFVADLFGAGVRPTEVKDKRQHTGELYTDRDKMRALMQGALAKAKGLGADTENSVAMGYCFGGAAVLELARSGADMKGYVSFHGGLTTPEGQDYSETEGKVLVLHGTADKLISMNDFGSLADQLETAGVDHEMTTYGGAPHAFTVFGSDRYRAEADRKSWASFARFLALTLQR